MRQHEVGARCNLCGGGDQVTTHWIQIGPSPVRIEICQGCRRSATAVEALDTGRPQHMGRPCEDVILASPNLL